MFERAKRDDGGEMIKDGKDLERIAERLEAEAAKREGYAERFTFYRGLLGLMLKARESWSVKPVPSDEEGEKVRMREGFPLMDRGRLTPDIPRSAALLSDLLDLVRREDRLPEETVSAAAVKLEKSAFREDLLLNGFRGEGSWPAEEPPAGDNGEGELWRFLAHCALKPFFESYALACAGRPALAMWEQGYCPVCGGVPACGCLRGDEGRRELLCHRCGHVWVFARVKCPFCGNADHEKLRYMSFEAEPLQRIYVCESCRGYLKTADLRSAPAEALMEAEDLATPHLDLVAAKEGYLKKAPNIIGL